MGCGGENVSLIEITSGPPKRCTNVLQWLVWHAVQHVRGTKRSQGVTATTSQAWNHAPLNVSDASF